MERTVFITGASGFVGGHLAGKLLARGFKVVGLYHDDRPVTTMRLLGLSDKVALVRGDICDYELIQGILARYYIQDVYHLATQAIVSVGLKDPLTTYRASCLGTASVLKACHDVGVRAILCTGSDKAYGEGLNKTETSPLEVQGIYESSKVCMDFIARSYHHTYQLPVVVSRACNIFGENDLNKRIVPNTMNSLKRGERPIIFKNDQSLREYVYVGDVCDAYMGLLENIEKTEGDVFNVGTGDVIGQEDLVKAMIRVSGVTVEPQYVDKPASLFEIHQQSIDSSKVRATLGWRPRYSLEEGLQKTWRG